MSVSGSPINYLQAFLGGIGVSFTPCVYPLIPVIVGYLGIEAGTTKLRGFALSFFYVTGIAITYSILGLFASLTGTLFGSISTNPITYFAVGCIIIIFGLSMYDLFKLPYIRFISQPLSGRKNYFSAFLLGLNSGLVISPCLAPVLGTILIYLATKKNLFYGASLLLSFAYGVGFIFILIGTFSSFILIKLPKAGKWMLYIKRFFSLLLIAMGIYFIYSGIRRL